jgi:hypothetical protein
MSKLAEIRARIAAQENKSRPQQTQSDGAFFPHWKVDEGKSVTLRFLPDGNDSNPDFWVERQMIKLPFNGVLGRPEMKRVEVQVPCIEMFGDQYRDACPVHQELKPWYKDESLKEMANRYWKKRSYIYQGFVRQSAIQEDNPPPENPIRRFLISPSIHKIVKAAIMDPEIMEIPTDYLRGLDFRISKTMKGENADYSTSSFARRESALTDAEQNAIEQYKLFNLREFLPKVPTDAELKIIFEMFQASVDGQAYDPARWASYYKPWGLQADGAKTEQQSSTYRAPATEPEDEEPAPVAQKVVVPTQSKPAISSDKAADILAAIRARQGLNA